MKQKKIIKGKFIQKQIKNEYHHDILKRKYLLTLAIHNNINV